MQQDGNNGELLVANQSAQKSNAIAGKRMGSKKKTVAAEAQVAEKPKLKLVNI
jgi:hypothetical protein